MRSPSLGFAARAVALTAFFEAVGLRVADAHPWDIVAAVIAVLAGTYAVILLVREYWSG